MPKKQTSVDVVEVFECWRCKKFHQFKRVRQVSKILPKHQIYNNVLYCWLSIECPSGSAYIEQFMPGEMLVKSSKRVRQS